MDVILHETTNLHSNTSADDVAEPALKSALHEARSDAIGEGLVFGNGKGLSILEELQDMKRTLSDLQKEVRIQGEEMRNQGEQMRDVARSCCKARMRFLDALKRNIFCNATDKDLKYTQEGNIAAHGGDALTDADL
jgi:hypothetical protein